MTSNFSQRIHDVLSMVAKIVSLEVFCKAPLSTLFEVNVGKNRPATIFNFVCGKGYKRLMW